MFKTSSNIIQKCITGRSIVGYCFALVRMAYGVTSKIGTGSSRFSTCVSKAMLRSYWFTGGMYHTSTVSWKSLLSLIFHHRPPPPKHQRMCSSFHTVIFHTILWSKCAGSRVWKTTKDSIWTVEPSSLSLSFTVKLSARRKWQTDRDTPIKKYIVTLSINGRVKTMSRTGVRSQKVSGFTGSKGQEAGVEFRNVPVTQRVSWPTVLTNRNRKKGLLPSEPRRPKPHWSVVRCGAALRFSPTSGPGPMVSTGPRRMDPD